MSDHFAAMTRAGLALKEEHSLQKEHRDGGRANLSWKVAGLVILFSGISAFAAKPSITTQPESQNVPVGQPVTFMLAATGTDPLTYQWRFNGTNISAATNTTFLIASAKFDDAGDYTVVVANHSGSVTSSNTLLTVGYPPSILQQPVSQDAPSGSNVAFAPIINGTLPLSYRWRFNGADISDQTNGTLVIADFQPDQAGLYTVVASNIYGSITSFPATLTAVGQIIIMDFKSLPPVAGFSVVSACQFCREKGFVLSPLTVANTFTYWETNSPNYPGSTALWLNSNGNYACLARSDGGFFDLLSIDLCTLLQGQISAVTLTGYNGLQEVGAFQASLTNVALRTFYLPGFTNLTEVRWQGATDSQHQFANITVIARPGVGPPPLIQLGSPSSILPLYLTHLRVQTAYVLQKSPDLVSWQPRISFTADTTTSLSWGDSFDPAVRAMFYRLQPVQ